MIATVIIKNPSHIKNEFRHERKRGLDAAKDSIYRESLRLKNLLRQEIKAGSPGGRPMAPLGAMALSAKKSRSSRSPLVRIAFMMRFFVFRRGATWYAKLGYVPKTGSGFGPKSSDISWGKILEKQAAGFSLEVTPRMRRKFIRLAMPTLGRWTGGGRSGGKEWKYKKSRAGRWQALGRSGSKMYVAKERSPFFVRKDTRLKIPARPFIEPFWTARRAQAMQNMRQNFRTNMKDKVLNGAI